MADDTAKDMAKVRRHVHGPRPVGALVPTVARPVFARAGQGVVQMMEAWPGIVGPSLAQTTTPRRMAQGTLTIACSGPVAMELQHLSTELIGRINQYLGNPAVLRLRFVQAAAPRSTLKPRPVPSPAAETAAASSVAHLPEGPLRAALSALGTAVLTESASRLGKQTRTIS